MEEFFRGCGWTPRFVEGDDPAQMHQKMAAALDWAVREILRIQQGARELGESERPPLAHGGVPLPQGLDRSAPARRHLPGPPAPPGGQRVASGAPDPAGGLAAQLPPGELFDASGAPVPALRTLPPQGERRMAANPHANGGMLLRDLRTPNFAKYAVEVPAPGAVEAEDMAELANYIRDLLKLNQKAKISGCLFRTRP